jgi:hypothetical protein
MTPSGVLQAKVPSPRAIINAGIKNNSIDEVSHGLRLASSPKAYHDLLSSALFGAVYNGSATVTQYLLSEEKAPLDTLTPLTVATSPSPELLSILVSHGWDLNQRSPDRGAGPSQRLLDLICDDEVLVRWCLEHGASVDEDPNTNDPIRCPPLLENVAAMGTTTTFQLLREQYGAKLGRRTLHRAVASAAQSASSERMEMVRYLVDELGLDVNQMDTDGQLPNHCGPPLCYAAKGSQGEEVVRFLLERGADPKIKDCWGNHDALSLAKLHKNQIVLGILNGVE